MNAIVELKGVGKTYTSARTAEVVQALHNINFEIERGEFLTVVGPSGCGKSTLLSLIAGFDTPTVGEVLFNGKKVQGPAPERGVMFQDYALFPWRTVAENIEFGPYARGVPAAERRAKAQQLLETVGLKGFEKRFPSELSGGMRQRCALARMLANEPEMWLMDEPLAAVDLQTRIILQDELMRLWSDSGNGGKSGDRADRPTVLFVTHGIDEAVLLADRVLVLGRRPGHIKAVVPVNLPRPRAALRRSPELAQLTEEVWNLIRDEAAEAIADEAHS